MDNNINEYNEKILDTDEEKSIVEDSIKEITEIIGDNKSKILTEIQIDSDSKDNEQKDTNETVDYIESKDEVTITLGYDEEYANKLEDTITRNVQSGGSPGAIAGLIGIGILSIPVIIAIILGSAATLVIGYEIIKLTQACIRVATRSVNKINIQGRETTFTKHLSSFSFLSKKQSGGSTLAGLLSPYMKGKPQPTVGSMVSMLMTKAILNPRQIISICNNTDYDIKTKLYNIAKVTAPSVTLALGTYGVYKYAKSKLNNNDDNSNPLNHIKNMISTYVTNSKKGGGNDNEQPENNDIINDLQNVHDALNSVQQSLALPENNIKTIIDNIQTEDNIHIQPKLRDDCYKIYKYYKDKLDQREHILKNDLKYLSSINLNGNTIVNTCMKNTCALFIEYNKILKKADLQQSGKKCLFKIVPQNYGRRIRKFLERFDKLQIDFTKIVNNTSPQQGGKTITGKCIKTVDRVIVTDKLNNKKMNRIVYKMKNTKYVLINKEYIKISSLKKSHKYCIDYVVHR